ncbi:protein BUNDLE SHEATH DEFECTIVE 2, chloroplastic isoform X2 [Mercurialis annua]|uniref:protein BUNDLE SHEATH DEFECTIVE 2, chloroplastic isoform X2 n=1 Tax=Mercurialis annua TaxID=3986 RepID=UPI002160E9F6|nr:protein BUNDLE SHEATH DEFECTIVE 2, chloroplastic isoform X2 [Mercurialis annua]
MTNCICYCSQPVILPKSNSKASFGRVAVNLGVTTARDFRVRASTVESSSNFAKRTEQAWLISQQPRPVVCTSCSSNGHIDCEWCAGTGFFIIGDNMLCQVPSRNTTCVICAGKGLMRCSDCKGTGFRAKWLEEPPMSK